MALQKPGAELQDELIAQKVLSVVEEQIDQQIEKMDRIDSDGLEELRQKRLDLMRRQEEQKREWLQLGHGQYDDLDERQFFNASKTSNLLLHFYIPTSERCNIVDHHFNILCKRHLEVRFVKMNASKCPFIAEKLNVSVIPTVLAVRDNAIVDRIIGFAELGNCDDFTTEMLEWRLAKSGVMDYEGDLRFPPDNVRTRKKFTLRNSSIREDFTDSDDSDE